MHAVFKSVKWLYVLTAFALLLDAASGQSFIVNKISCVTTTSTTNVSICSSQIPFKWNGNSYTAGGTYNVKLINTAGCDSVATLNLTVSNTVTSSTNITICPNQLPYLWNGNNYTSAGSYSVTLKNSAGCDSIAKLNLTVKNITTSTTNVNICAAQLPYVWNGNSYIAAGSYSVTLNNSAGCDSIAKLNLTVKKTSTSTANVNICASQLPYVWNGNNYNASGSYSIIFPNSAGCDSIAVLNLMVNNATASSTDISICLKQLPYKWNNNTYNAAGTYNVTLLNAAGCDSVATLDLTVTNPTSNTYVIICTGQLPYKWNGNTYNASGTYSVVLKGTGGCDSVATLNLTATNTILSNTSVKICTMQIPYVWNGNNYTATGTYTANFVSSGGCDSVASLDLTVSDTIHIHNPITICSNQLPYQFHSIEHTAAGTYFDTSKNSAGCETVTQLDLTVLDTSKSITDVTICSNQGFYTWNGNNYTLNGTYTAMFTSSTGCDSVAVLNLTLSNIVTSTTNVAVCPGQLPYFWNGNSYLVAGTYNINLKSNAGCDSVATLNLIVKNTSFSSTDITVCSKQLPYIWNGNSYTAAGTYKVTLTNAAGCDSVAVLNLNVSNVTTTTTINICPNQLPYKWNGNSYAVAGTYSVTLTGSGGCDSIATLNLTVNTTTTSTTNINICSNQLPYKWNGKNYISGGSYSVTLTGSGGCDSIATLNLIVSNVTTSTTNINICFKQLPYVWNGNNYTSAGTYNVTLTNTAGCDSIATLNLTVSNATASTTNTNICSKQLPYLWNGNNYTSTGIYNIKLTNSAGCDSIATLSLIVSNATASTTNTNICPNQLPYLWNGNSYTSGGTYNVTLTNAAGCDSIATLSLTVSNATSSTTNTNICSKQLPYVWNGNNYTSAGTYNVTLTNSAGCDSIATLNLDVSNATSSTTNVNICPKELPFTWNGNTYTTAGSYNVTLINAAGCDSIAALNLTVSNSTSSITGLNICSNQLPYLWNNNSYTAAGTYNVNLTNAAGCDSIATLNLIVSNTTTSITTANICSNQLPYVWNGISYNKPGNYNLKLVNAAGCDSIATLNLVIRDTTFSITNANICSNQLPYIWNGNNYNKTGTYDITLTNVAGCDSIATLNLNVSNATTSITNINICPNQIPFSWNGISYTTAGTYTVILTNSAGCDSTATLNLFVSNATTSTATINICSNQLPYSWNSNSYTATGTYNVKLTNAAGCDSIAILNLIISDTAQSFTSINICQKQVPYIWNGISYTMSGTYTARLKTVAGCDSVAVLNLTVSTSTASTTNINVCPDQLPYAWNGISYTAAGTYIVTLTNAAGCDSVANLNLTVLTSPAIQNAQLSSCGSLNFQGITYTTSTTLTDTLKSRGGCDSIYYITSISIFPNNLNLSLNASPAKIYNGIPVTVASSANIPYRVLEWQPASLFRAQNALTQTFIADSSLRILAIAKSNSGCIDSASLSLNVIQVNVVYVPSAFTPNGDGSNDVFKPMVYGRTTQYHFVVFNRWGKKIFDTEKPGAGWDGMLDSQPQAQGTFIWMLSYTLTNGVSKNEKGTVVLIR